MSDARLDTALALSDPWTALQALAVDPPGGTAELAARLGERYERAGARERWLLTYLLRLLEEKGDPVLLELLGRAGAADPASTADLVSATVQRGLAVPAPVLDRVVERLGFTRDVVDALGLSGDPARAKVLGRLLGDGDVGGRAALALARLGAREWTVTIARRLPKVTGLNHVAFAVALERMGDPAAVPYLLRWLTRGPDLPAGDVHLALARLTGHDPLIPEWRTGDEFSAHVRRIWPTRDLAAPPLPQVRDVVVESPRRLRFSLDEGRGRIRVDYDPPSPGSSWPRWNKTLHVGPHALYRVTSDCCGTCETTMSLLGFPPAEARSEAARVGRVLACPRELRAETVRALEPLIHELETGHYRAYLADLPLERVADPEQSWWLRRAEARDDTVRWSGDATSWPGTEHFQTPHVLADRPPAYCGVLPSQPLDALEPATVDRYAAAIAQGERPAALLLAWTEERWIEAEWEEHFLVGVILDGHHRVAAYAAAGVPARVLLLERNAQPSIPNGILDAL